MHDHIENIVGSAEAAKLLGIGSSNFSHTKKKELAEEDSLFPAPTWTLQCGPIWLESVMLKYKEHYDSRRRRVRPEQSEKPVKKVGDDVYKFLRDRGLHSTLTVGDLMEHLELLDPDAEVLLDLSGYEAHVVALAKVKVFAGGEQVMLSPSPRKKV